MFIVRYINLEWDFARRKIIEDSFCNANFSSQWTLERFPAVTPNDSRVHDFQMKMNKRIAACKLSHLECVRSWANGHDDRHLFVVEDDRVFLEKTEKYFLSAIDQAGSDWDFIYSDMHFGLLYSLCDLSREGHRHATLNTFNDMYHLRNVAASEKKVSLFQMQDNRLWSSGAYLLNSNRKKHIIEVIEECLPSTDHIDIFYVKMFARKKLKAYFTLPFLTTMSDEVFKTSIQPSMIVENYFDIALNKYVFGLHEDAEGFQQMLGSILEKYLGLPVSELFKTQLSGYIPLIFSCFQDKWYHR